MKITWQVDDGYFNGKRPQTTEIPDEDLEELETDDAREAFIYRWIQEEFEQNTTWYIISREE